MPPMRKVVLIALAVLVGGFALRLVNCNRGILADEITTYWVSRLPAPRIVEERLAHNHLPTYFLLMRLWINSVGASELTLRLPSMASGALAVVALFLICARRFPLGLSLLAATLFGLNATHLFVSQWSRMYALTALLELLFFGCLLSDLRRPSWKRFLGYAVVVIAGCCLHLLFLQMAAIASGLLIWERLSFAKKRWPRSGQRGDGDATQPPEAGTSSTPTDRSRSLAGDLLRYVSPFLVGAILLLIWSSHAQTLERGGRTAAELSWLDGQTSPVPLHPSDGTPAKRRVSDPSRVMLRVVLGDFGYWPWLQSGWPKHMVRTVLWLFVGGLLWAAFRGEPTTTSAADFGAGLAGGARSGVDTRLGLEQWRAMHFAVLWAVLPPLMMLVGAMLFVWVPPPAPRWLVGAAAAWALLLACGAWRLPGGVWGRRSAACALVVLSACFAWGWLRYPGDGLRQAFAYWRMHARPEDKVFLAHRGYLEQAMHFEGITQPPAPLRSGTVLDYYTGPEGARRLIEFAAADSPLWVLHYRFPPRTVLEEAFALMAPAWRADLVVQYSACSVYRLTRVSGEP